jgi:hypothetical protein
VSDEPTNGAQRVAPDELPEAEDMELRERLTLLEEHNRHQDQIIILLSVVALCVAVLLVVRTVKK